MSLVVTPLLTDIDLAESATPWSTGAVDPAFFKQGSNSIAFYMAKNARGSITVTPAASVAWSTYSLPHLYFWMSSAVSALMENKSTGTTTASGITVRVTLASGAYREWHVTGADTWAGDWKDAFVVDLSHTGTELYASSGTWTNTSNIASVTWYIDLSNSGNIRNVPANHWIDAIRVGDGIQAWNTSDADPAFGFAEIAAQDEAVANQYGVLRQLKAGAAGSFGAAGRVVIGDSAGSNHVDFLSNDETLTFLELDGSGYGIVNLGLYDLSFVGNATGTDQDVYLGTKVGSGDTMTGRNGTAIKSGGPNVTYSVDLSNASLHNVGWYGSTIAGANGGVTTTAAPTTLFEWGGVTVDSCLQVDYLDAVVRKLVALNTVAAATSGAVKWVNGTTDTKNSLFVNNAVAIEIPDNLAADVTFVGMEFQGNTKDVRYEGTTGPYDLNWSDAPGAPVIENASTGVLTAVNTVTLEINGVTATTTQCSVHANAGGPETEGTELMNELADATGKAQESYAYVSSQPVRVQARLGGYLPYDAPGTIDASGLTVTAVWLIDPNYGL